MIFDNFTDFRPMLEAFPSWSDCPCDLQMPARSEAGARKLQHHYHHEQSNLYFFITDVNDVDGTTNRNRRWDHRQLPGWPTKRKSLFRSYHIVFINRNAAMAQHFDQ